MEHKGSAGGKEEKRWALRLSSRRGRGRGEGGVGWGHSSAVWTGYSRSTTCWCLFLTSAERSVPAAAGQPASYHVALAGLELEVVCFVKHRVLLHEELLIELLDYLRERERERQVQGEPEYLKRSGIHRQQRKPRWCKDESKGWEILIKIIAHSYNTFHLNCSGTPPDGKSYFFPFPLFQVSTRPCKARQLWTGTIVSVLSGRYCD